MKNGFTELGDTLQGNMQRVSSILNTKSAEMGTINADLSLTTDSFPVPIPKGDYMVDARLVSGDWLTIEDGTHSGHTEGIGKHEHTAKVRGLQSGDRVLVAKVGTERIVLAVVVSSNNL